MARYAHPFTLWILCMDEKAHEVLQRMDRRGVRLIPISEVETPELVNVRQKRTHVEYCWTLTPWTPKIVFERDKSVERVTYLDADMYFFKSPEPIHEEFRVTDKSVLISDHAYDFGNDHAVTSGQYCVQFMTFVRDKSEPVRRWWEARCLEWCFARRENGRYGDQKYLDDWPRRFPEQVHVLQQLNLLLGPWNTKRFHYSQGVAWHFHGLRLLKGGKVQLHPGYSVSTEVHTHVYLPYVELLRHVSEETGEHIVQSPSASFWHIIPSGIRSLLKRGLKMAAKVNALLRSWSEPEISRQSGFD